MILISSFAIIGTARLYRARSVWSRNMGIKTTEDQRTEMRFDEIRRGGQHEHHIEHSIPESPEVVIRRKK